ncbi:hypothetical protein Tco_1124750 [Tanacetum coccineum]|uniref:Uncharacterized protein n=1 Tax=Tanacetum coccineum TaxID=301880 RepID=A0ABQ5J8H0_9ASTR
MPSRTNGVLLIKAEQAKLNGDRWRIYYLKLHHRAVTLREPARESVEHGYTAAELAAELVSARSGKDQKCHEAMKPRECVMKMGNKHVYFVELEVMEELLEEEMLDEEVSLLDGVFKGSFGALEALEMEALVDSVEVYGG